MLAMGNDISRAVNSRYSNRSVSDAVEELPIAQKVEVYKELHEQLAILGDLEVELVHSIRELDDEEVQLRSREDFIERRRKHYLRRLNKGGPIAEGAEEEDEDDYDSSDDEDEEDEEEEGPVPAKEDEVFTAQVTEGEAEVQKKDENDLGSIKVQGGPGEIDDPTRAKLKQVLEVDLPDIQRSVAVKLRTIEWKRDDFEDKLTDTREKMLELQALIDQISPGIPSLTTTSTTSSSSV